MFPIIDIRVPSPAVKPTHGSKLPIKAPFGALLSRASHLVKGAGNHPLW